MKNPVLYTNYEEMPIVLSAKDVSTALRISRSNTYRLLSSEGFPCITVGKRMVVPKTAFIRWLEESAATNKRL